MFGYVMSDYDKKVYAEQLADFLPDKMIDAHAHIWKKEFSLPPLPLACAQTFVACADLIVAAYCLYVLLPPDSGISFASFLPNYLLAQVAVVLTHVPGGVGVLEVILMHIVHGVQPALLFGAILVFRVLYCVQCENRHVKNIV